MMDTEATSKTLKIKLKGGAGEVEVDTLHAGLRNMAVYQYNLPMWA